MEKKRAYMYTRVSTAMQVEGYSLEAQEERLRRHCERKAYARFGKGQKL